MLGMEGTMLCSTYMVSLPFMYNYSQRENSHANNGFIYISSMKENYRVPREWGLRESLLKEIVFELSSEG